MEIEGVPFGEEPEEEIYTREAAAMINYEANLQGISERGVAEIMDVNLRELETKEE